MIGARSLARIMMRELVDMFDRPTAIVNQLMGAGLSYRRQDMFRDVNKALDIKRYLAGHLGERAGSARPVGDLVRDWDMPEGKRYRIFGLASYEDSETGDTTQRLVSIYSDYNASDNAIADLFMDEFDGQDSNYELSFRGLDVLYVSHNPKMDHIDLIEE